MKHTLTITTEYIRLDEALKKEGLVQTGGEAKLQIQGGRWQVNGEVCLMRGKKLREGDVFGISGDQTVWEVTAK